MKTPTRTPDTPWQAINVLTELCVGWYDTENGAYIDNYNEPVNVFYRPTRRKPKVKK